MNTTPNNDANAAEPSAAGPNGGGPFGLRGVAVWLPGCLLLSSLAAWAAEDAQFYFAPFLIFPLLVGIGLGAVLVLLMRVGQVGHRPTILLGTLLAALVAVVGQHYFGFLDAQKLERRETAAIEKAKAALPELAARLPPAPAENFCRFMRQQAGRGRSVFNLLEVRGGGAWALWTVEGLLTLAAALGVVIPAMRLPFCKRCRSWYRAARSARFPAAVIRDIAKVLDVETAERIRSGRCRLLNCASGCGPTGCELSWEDLDGNTFFARVWLDPAARNAVAQVFDEAQKK
ncbi:MAG: hypothetical protein IT426_12695 [Pirellulales bacterium]|nr:hypothetical protein [Pirellulales bacterium]